MPSKAQSSAKAPPFNSLHTTTSPKIATFDQKVVDYPIQQCVDIGKAAIEKALSANPGYDCSVGFGKGQGKRRLMNSAGLDVSFSSTSFGIGIEILLIKENSFLSIGEGEGAKYLVTDLDKHVNKALEGLKLAERELKIKTGNYPVVVTAKAMGNLLSTFEIGCSGKLVQKGASPLTNRLGEKLLTKGSASMTTPRLIWAIRATRATGKAHRRSAPRYLKGAF